MSTGANAITDQAGVNGAGSFQGAAESLLGIDSSASMFPQEEEAQGTSADNGGAGSGGEAGAKSQGDAAAAGGAEQQGEQQKAATQAQQDEWAVDQSLLDKALADPTHGAIVKALHEKYQKALGWKEHWATPDEARDARALAPGGLEELKGLVERARSAQTEAADFASGVPERQKSALLSIAEEMPEQFVAGLPVYLQIAAEKNPESYAKYVRGELQRSLEADGVPALFQNFFAAMGGDPDKPEQAKAFEDSVRALYGWADQAGLVKKAEGSRQKKVEETPEVKRLREENATFKANEHKAHAEAFTAWWAPTEQDISKQVREDLKTKLTEFVPPNTESTFKEMVLGRLLDEAESKISGQLRSDQDFQAKLGNVLKDRAWSKDGAAVRTQYVNLTLARAKQVMPFVIQKLTEGMTRNAVQSAADKNAREQARGAAADVRGHQGGHGPKGKLSINDVKRGGLLAGKTDEEILNS